MFKYHAESIRTVTWRSRVHVPVFNAANLKIALAASLAKASTAMPPGSAYNWLCVLHSTAEILSHAARHRAAQIVPKSTSSPLNSRKLQRTEETVDIPVSVDHARSTEKSSGHEPIVNTSSITQNVDIQVGKYLYYLHVRTCSFIDCVTFKLSRTLRNLQRRYQKNLSYIPRQSFKTQIYRR